MLIVYRDTSSFDAAQYVLDSVLTVPYSSGVGRETRWPTTSYSRVTTTSGDVAALIGLRRRVDRDSMRALLAGNPLVKTIIDTTIEH